MAWCWPAKEGLVTHGRRPGVIGLSEEEAAADPCPCLLAHPSISSMNRGLLVQVGLARA